MTMQNNETVQELALVFKAEYRALYETSHISYTEQGKYKTNDYRGLVYNELI